MTCSTWSAGLCPLRIQYDPDAIRKLHRKAGTRAVSGVLYGRLDADTLRIESLRLVPGNSSNAVWAKLASAKPKGLVAVGFFSVRERIALTDSDVMRLRCQFPARWQTALILNPGGRAGFFVRSHDGTLDAARSPAEFDLY
ncbi:MAG: hypothetical protein ABI823_18185, partial [Bryobacteraceae bacterium]